MRTFLASLIVLLTAFAFVPAANAIDPNEVGPCEQGLGWDWCNYNVLVCHGQARFYHIEPVQEADVHCLNGTVDCTLTVRALVPGVPQCDAPTAALPPLGSSNPVECWDGINGDGWCGVHVLGCDAGRAYTSTPKYDQWLEAGCASIADCIIDFDSLDLERITCDF